MAEPGRYALVVSSSRYSHPTLRPLTAPVEDAESFGELLRDRGVGGFRVRPVIDQPSWVVAEEVETFFRERRLGDLALFYFSGHGIKDEDGSLYFATMNTNPNSLLATTVPSELVNASMRKCRSRQQVLILDCCYAGAFSKAMLAKSDETVGIQERFKSEAAGRVVISASDAMQVALDGQEILGEQTLSAFTRILVDGIRDGEADLDHDGHVSLDELFDYVSARMEKECPDQTPTISNLDKKGRIVIAFNPRIEVPPIPPGPVLPPDPSPDPDPKPPPPPPPPAESKVRAWIREHRGLAIALVVLVLAAVIAAVVIPMLGGGGGSDDNWALADVGTDVLDGSIQQKLEGITVLPGGGSAIAVGVDHRRAAVWSYESGAWSKVPQDRVDTRSGHMYAVSSTLGETVAVGSIDESNGNVDAMAWKLEGAQWKRATCAATDCGGSGPQQMFAVTPTSGGGLIAVGRDAQGGAFEGAVWRSSDNGATWRRIARHEVPPQGTPNQAMRAVIETGGRLVAVGRNGKSGAIWTSTDNGGHWLPVSSPALQNRERHSIELLGIVTLDTPSGSRLIAVGRDEGPDGKSAAAWYSDDGRRWLRATIENLSSSGQQMIGVVSGRDGLTVVGNASDTEAGMWQSPDGATWAGVQSKSFSLSSGMTSMATLNDGTSFAVGTSIWESPPG